MLAKRVDLDRAFVPLSAYPNDFFGERAVSRRRIVGRIARRD
jgi:hypothetical protein